MWEVQIKRFAEKRGLENEAVSLNLIQYNTRANWDSADRETK